MCSNQAPSQVLAGGTPDGPHSAEGGSSFGGSPLELQWLDAGVEHSPHQTYLGSSSWSFKIRGDHDLQSRVRPLKPVEHAKLGLIVPGGRFGPIVK